VPRAIQAEPVRLSSLGVSGASCSNWISLLKLNNDSGASSLFFARAPEASKAIRIFVAVGTASGMRFERDALAERTTNAERRFVFREWTFVREQRQSVAPQRSLARSCF
jgi:hypothetical protein